MDAWMNENRPLRDPDYARIAEATKLLDSELAAGGTPEQSYDRRVVMDVLTVYAARRAEQTSAENPKETPGALDLFTLLLNVAFEGFAYGVLFVQSRAKVREALLDRLTLADVGHALQTHLSDQQAMEGFYASLVSLKSLQFVSFVRAQNYAVRLRVKALPHQRVKESQAALWMDMFLLGAVFEELGGHREGPESV